MVITLKRRLIFGSHTNISAGVYNISLINYGICVNSLKNICWGIRQFEDNFNVVPFLVLRNIIITYSFKFNCAFDEGLLCH